MEIKLLDVQLLKSDVEMENKMGKKNVIQTIQAKKDGEIKYVIIIAN
jgi:hypothetical protein